MISFFIPIRENSRRIKYKSTRKIGKFNLGLTEIKVNHLKKLKILIKKNKKIPKIEFIVSTDSNKVKKYIENFSWIKIHNRSKRLASDDCLDDLIKEVPKICTGNIILWTHVTSPCFNEFCYKDFIIQFLKNFKRHDSAFSADLIGTYILNSKYKWVSHNIKKKKWPRTQDLEKLFSVNSAAFIANKKTYLEHGNRLGNKPLPILSKEKTGFDIDEMEDLIFFKKNLMR